MAETLAQIGYLTLLKLGDDASPESFATIKEVKSISGFGFVASEVNATHMESPNGYEEFVAGMKTGNTVTYLVNMTTENATQLKGVWDAGLRRNFELNLPSADLPDYDFSAVPTAWSLPTLTPQGLVETELQFRLTGAIT